MAKRVCPGCHDNDFITLSDRFGDGDFWFHCFTCGTDTCVDYEDAGEFFGGMNPPKKSPPYINKTPLPRKPIWPGAMTPLQIRQWMTKNNVKVDSKGTVIQPDKYQHS